ncbi:hypothetical protein BH09ACT12_BH09ACT12_07020 [soil metagenome]
MTYVAAPARLCVITSPIMRAGVHAAIAAHSQRLISCSDSAVADLVLLDAAHLTRWRRLQPPVVVLARRVSDPPVMHNPLIGDVRVLPVHISATALVAALLDVLKAAPDQPRNPALTPAHEPNAPTLTRREAEVLTLICRGSTNVEIAQALFLSINSIKTHIRVLYRKIEVERRSQAVIWGMAHGYGRGTDLPA